MLRLGQTENRILTTIQPTKLNTPSCLCLVLATVIFSQMGKSKKQFRKEVREMVKYILPKENRNDNEVINNYTETFINITENYIKENLEWPLNQLEMATDRYINAERMILKIANKSTWERMFMSDELMDFIIDNSLLKTHFEHHLKRMKNEGN